MIFIFITIMAIITIAILAKQKEVYFVSFSFKRSRSYLYIQIFQVLVIYMALIFANYSNKVFVITLFSISILEVLKLYFLKKIVNEELNKETNMPYKLTDVISRFSLYSRIIFWIVLNIIGNWFVFR